MDRTNNNGEREETWCISNNFYMSLNLKKNQYMADMDENMIMMIPSSNSENF